MKFWISQIKRTLSRNKDEEVDQLKIKFKAASKSLKQIAVSVLAEEIPFKKNAVKIYIQYIEFFIQCLNVYKLAGFKKRIASLKEIVGSNATHLPKDPNLRKVVDRFLKFE